MNIPSGLYTILINSTYISSIDNDTNGLYFGQIYVAYNETTLANLYISNGYDSTNVYMGNTLQIDADIQYPNGNEVQFGMYSAAIFPLEAINDAFNAESEEYIPLQYNPADQLWEGVAYMPSYLDSGSLDPYISGPYSYPDHIISQSMELVQMDFLLGISYLLGELLMCNLDFYCK